MKIQCEQCGHWYELPDHQIGEMGVRMRCQTCGRELYFAAPRMQTVVKMAMPLSEIEWHCASHGQTMGPMPYERLCAMIGAHQLTAQDMVWNETFVSGWLPIEAIPELKALMMAQPAAPAQPAPPAMPQTPSTRPAGRFAALLQPASLSSTSTPKAPALKRPISKAPATLKRPSLSMPLAAKPLAASSDKPAISLSKPSKLASLTPLKRPILNQAKAETPETTPHSESAHATAALVAALTPIVVKPVDIPKPPTMAPLNKSFEEPEPQKTAAAESFNRDSHIVQNERHEANKDAPAPQKAAAAAPFSTAKPASANKSATVDTESGVTSPTTTATQAAVPEDIEDSTIDVSQLELSEETAPSFDSIDSIEAASSKNAEAHAATSDKAKHFEVPAQTSADASAETSSQPLPLISEPTPSPDLPHTPANAQPLDASIDGATLAFIESAFDLTRPADPLPPEKEDAPKKRASAEDAFFDGEGSAFEDEPTESEAIANNAPDSASHMMLIMERDLELAHSTGRSYAEVHQTSGPAPIMPELSGIGDPVGSINFDPQLSPKKPVWLIAVAALALVGVALFLFLRSSDEASNAPSNDIASAPSTPAPAEEDAAQMELAQDEHAKKDAAQMELVQKELAQSERAQENETTAKVAAPHPKATKASEDGPKRRAKAQESAKTAQNSTTQHNRYESLRSAGAALPQTPIAPQKRAELSQNDIQATLQIANPRFTRCYDRCKNRQDGTCNMSKLNISFTVQPNGKAIGARFKPSLQTGSFFKKCMQETISSLQFPAFEGTAQEVNYPLIFTN